jgi:hypothetical protein
MSVNMEHTPWRIYKAAVSPKNENKKGKTIPATGS